VTHHDLALLAARAVHDVEHASLVVSPRSRDDNFFFRVHVCKVITQARPQKRCDSIRSLRQHLVPLVCHLLVTRVGTWRAVDDELLPGLVPAEDALSREAASIALLQA
jgi:hypothetical protein